MQKPIGGRLLLAFFGVNRNVSERGRCCLVFSVVISMLALFSVVAQKTYLDA